MHLVCTAAPAGVIFHLCSKAKFNMVYYNIIMIIIHCYILLYTVWHRLFYWDFRLCYTEILFTEIHYTEIQDTEIAPEILRLLRLLPRFWDYWDCSRDIEITEIAPEI